MSNAPAKPPGMPSLADKLKNVRLGLRDDLDVTRHLFRDCPAYVVRDPVTFQSQRFEPADYDVLARIEASRSLGEIFDGLVSEGRAEKEDEEKFYAFIMSLHRIGFLQLPVSDDKVLYRRYQQKELAKRKEKMLGFLFFRVPLWNPDVFLTRTIHKLQFVYRAWFVAIWLVGLMAAGYILMRRWDDVAEPLQKLLVAQNLPLMWITLIGLKFFHEFGHAYACKHYGGHVPEMGAYVILFTPCAYMDATASWGFTKKYQRLLVCVAGMYFESFVAIVAVFVWSTTQPGLLHSAAYNIIFLATVVTVLFNINPLMRYDGYYIMSDITEIPNLRAKSKQYVFALLKRLLLKVPVRNVPKTARTKFILAGYGIAASIYRLALMMAISAMLASKVFLLGIGLALFYIGNTVVRAIVKLVKYLWYAEETAGVRGRAIAMSAVALVIFPVALFVVPLPSHVYARGVLLADVETVVRNREPGFVQSIHVEPEQTIAADELLVELRNDAHFESVADARANLRATEIRMDAYREHEPNRLQQEKVQEAVYQRELAQAQTRMDDLAIHAVMGGRVVECLDRDDTGRFLPAGSPIATVVSGPWQLRAILTQEQSVNAEAAVGDKVEFKGSGISDRTIEATIARIAPAGTRTIEQTPLTHLGGGEIAVNPKDHTTSVPYFEITVNLPESTVRNLRYGMTGSIRIPAKAEPIGTKLTRRFTRFLNKLLQE